MSLDEKMSEILDVEFPSVKSNVALQVIEPPDVSGAANNSLIEDAQAVRTNIRTLIAQGTQAVSELLVVARDLQTPRSYEVIAGLLKTMAELSHDLLDVHKKEHDYSESPAEGGDVNFNNSVFVGSTSDLSELIRKKRQEYTANTITVPAKVIEHANGTEEDST